MLAADFSFFFAASLALLSALPFSLGVAAVGALPVCWQAFLLWAADSFTLLEALALERLPSSSDDSEEDEEEEDEEETAFFFVFFELPLLPDSVPGDLPGGALGTEALAGLAAFAEERGRLSSSPESSEEDEEDNEDGGAATLRFLLACLPAWR